jgi:hypothetical protein
MGWKTRKNQTKYTHSWFWRWRVKNDTFTTVQCLSQNKLVKNILFQFERWLAKNHGKEYKILWGCKNFFLTKEKILEISKIFSNPFWKDVFYSLYLAKPLVKLNIKECLSLDLLNFVLIDDFPFYMRWENAGVNKLKSYDGYCYKKFLDFWKD